MTLPTKLGDPDEITTLPCGCVITCTWTTGPEMQIAPCRMDCVNLRNALGLADEKGTPVEYREGP